MNVWSHCFSHNINQKLQGFLPCSAAQHRAEIFTIFGSYFGRNDDFIHSFWNLLIFGMSKNNDFANLENCQTTTGKASYPVFWARNMFFSKHFSVSIKHIDKNYFLWKFNRYIADVRNPSYHTFWANTQGDSSCESFK